MDVREDTSLGDGDSSEELVQFLVVADGELDVAGSYAGPLVVLGGVSRKLEKLGGEVLKYRGHVDRSSRADTLGKATLAKEAMHAADGELKTCLGAPGRGLSSFSHLDKFLGLELVKFFLNG